MGDLIVFGIKIAVVVTAATAFGVVLLSLINGISSLVFGNVIGEVLGIMSMCLPFSPASVFSAIKLAMASVLAFLIGKKIWDLFGEGISLTH